MGTTTRHRLWKLIEPDESMRPGQVAMATLFFGSALATSAAYAVHTLPDLSADARHNANAVFLIGSLIFVGEFLARLWLAPQNSAEPGRERLATRRRYLLSPLGVVDLLAALPIPLILSGLASYDGVGEFAIFSLCKAGRYVRGLSLLAQVIRNEGRALISVLLVLLVLVMVASGLMFRFEHAAQPEVFSSVPRTVWWAVVTIATVGYGDMTPITDGGRVIAGVIMILGVAMFAMPAGILASGFASEMHRRSFLVTWQTVANVPLFTHLNATQIAEITRLLQPQVVPAHRVIVHHGDPAEAMYFIMKGEVEVEITPRPVRLKAGQYFGEIALLRDIDRTATVISIIDCQLLVLSAEDYRSLVDQHPVIGERITRIAENRLAELERGHGKEHH